jgi:hypothetical protein
MKPPKMTLDPRRFQAGTPLTEAAIQHLEQLVGPQPLADSRVRAHLKAPGPRERDRKTDAFERRVERVGLGVLDRYCRETYNMSWHSVSRFIEVGTRGRCVPTERELERAHEGLLSLERILGYHHPEPRAAVRVPRLRRAEARWAEANQRIGRLRDGADPTALHADLARAQAELYETPPAWLRELEAEFRKVARADHGVKMYTLSPEELDRQFPRRG